MSTAPAPIFLPQRGQQSPDVVIDTLHPRFKDPVARFSEKYRVDESTGCWIWTAGKDACGYGHIGVNGRLVGAHRVSYQIHHGEIPAGMHVLHRCDNPSCVNPSHLFAGTHAQNMEDMTAKGRRKSSRMVGDENPSRKHPERLRRGDNHPCRLHPERMARGEASGQSKLKESHVREMRRLHAAGEANFVELGRRFGVTRENVAAIVKRRTWKHVI